MKITKSQLNYIVAINMLEGGGTSQKNICEYLGVSKPSASVALKNLEDEGFIEKRVKSYFLTDKALKVVENITREKFEFISLFNEHLGIDLDLCERVYKNICGDLTVDFVNELSMLRKNEYRKKECLKNKSEGFEEISDGVYEIQFQIINGGEETTSMGDKGFIHPAVFIVNNGHKEILLESRQMYYRSKNNQILKGKLKELYYCYNSRWVLAEERKEDVWVIPVERLKLYKDSFGKTAVGVIEIEAVATTKKMPKSTAKATFNFKLIKKIR